MSTFFDTDLVYYFLKIILRDDVGDVRVVITKTDGLFENVCLLNLGVEKHIINDIRVDKTKIFY